MEGPPAWKTRLWHLRDWGVWWSLTRPWSALRFVVGSREVTNFRYLLKNVDELTSFLARTFHVSRYVVDAYVREFRDDKGLESELRRRLASRADRDRALHPGRRLGWYVITRLRRPHVVVETGTHDGLGASIFAAALSRNAEEGVPGHLYTFDVAPEAGWLIPARLRGYVTVVRGDLRETLPRFTAALANPIDVFLHDSDHSKDHETFEFETVRSRLAADAVVLSDNAHATRALAEFSRRHGREYAFWKEIPKGHPYPGGGVGLSLTHNPAVRRTGIQRSGVNG